MRKYLLLSTTLFIGICSHISLGQGTAQNEFNPNVTPPSPEASALAKYVEVPIGYYTGTYDLPIPLTGIKQGSLSLPVSLSYHSSGNRVEEIAPWTGLGWVLNAGGVITRVVRNSVDDRTTSSVTNFFNFTTQTTYAALADINTPNVEFNYAEISNGCIDSEPDQFIFNFNGYSGKFMFDWNRNLVVSCSKKIKVIPLRGTNNTDPSLALITGFDIIGEDGTIYKFSATETTFSRRPTGTPLGCQSNYTYVSAWYLTEVTDVNQENTITLTYDNTYKTTYTQPYSFHHSNDITGGNSVELQTYSGFGLAGTVNEFVLQASEIVQFVYSPPSPYCLAGTNPPAEETTSKLTHTGIHLSKISSSSGNMSINFVYGDDRTDTQDIDFGSSGTLNFKTLGSIVVKDRDDIEKKTFKFNYDYSVGRLTLKSVVEQKDNVDLMPPTLFEYNTATPLPTSFKSYAQDHWGFYNGANTNLNTLPPYWITRLDNTQTFFVDGANREVDITKTQAGILKLVTYPTGGKVEFDYEPNQYSFIQGSNVSSLSQYTSTPETKNALGIGTGSGSIEDVKIFTILPIQGQPTQKIIVKISYSARSRGMIPSQKPRVRLFDSANSLLFDEIFSGDPNNPDEEVTYPEVSFYKQLLPGSYTLKAIAVIFDGVRADFTDIRVDYGNPTNQIITKKIAGGVRIKEKREYPDKNILTDYITKTYSYDIDASTSAGVIYQEPRYQYGYNQVYTSTDPSQNGYYFCNKAMTQSNNVVMLGTTQGSHIGYREVTETIGKSPYSGKSVMKYTSPFDAGFQDVIHTDNPFPPADSYSFKTGLLTEKIDYVYDGTGTGLSKPVQKEEREYEYLNYSVPTLKVSKIPGEIYGVGAYLLGNYVNILGHFQAKKTTITSYTTTDNTVSATAITNMTYDASLQNLKTQTSEMSVGEKLKKELYYAGEFISPTTAITQMQTKNMVGIPLETITKRVYTDNSEKIIDGGVSVFGYNSSKIRLSKLYKIRTLVPIANGVFDYAFDNSGGTYDSNYDQELEYLSFDTYGNPLEVKPRTSTNKSMLWGYNGALPIAEISNATQSQVQASLIASNITLPTDFNTFSLTATQKIKIKAFQNKLYTDYQALANWYTHDPIYGLTASTDPTGISMSYQYDDLGRLNTVKDKDDNILKKYGYQYAGATSGGTGCTVPAPTITSAPASTGCSSILTTSACAGGSIAWSDGQAGNTILVPSAPGISYTATCTSTCTSPSSNALAGLTLPSGWSGVEIGFPMSGCTVLGNGQVRLRSNASTYGIGGSDPDNHYFFEKSYTGNVTIVAKIVSISNSGAIRTGLMFKDNIGSKAPFFTIVQQGDNVVGKLYRNVTNADALIWQFETSAPANVWMKIKKTGNIIQAYYSTAANPSISNDTDWIENLPGSIGNPAPSITWGSSFLVGMTLSNPTTSGIPTAQVIFSNVQINNNGVLENPF
jgi:YD repeat-containing protein